MTAKLARIDLFPIKSLDSAPVPMATVLASGALRHDRTWALCDQAGKLINGKRDSRIHQVRSRFTDPPHTMTLWVDDPASAQVFHLEEQKADVETWFSQYFQQPVALQKNLETGFPDDLVSPGPTVVSTATLQTVADWHGLSLEETRARFRTNLEIDGVPAFWEDQLYSESGEPVPFQIGEVMIQGINPCQRCPVPTRNPFTGEVTPGFQKQFAQQREATFPAGVARSRFNHFYRLTVNTRIAANFADQALRVGDPVSLV